MACSNLSLFLSVTTGMVMTMCFVDGIGGCVISALCNSGHLDVHWTVLHMFTQLLFWAGNQGNHQNFKLIFLKKANPKWPTQKKLVFQFCQFSTCFFFKNFMDWSLVSRIDWCKGHWCESTYMVVRLSNVSSKTGKKCIFWICFSIFFFASSPWKSVKVSWLWVEVLMITLVSSPKQQLRKHMQYSVVSKFVKLCDELITIWNHLTLKKSE